MLDAAPYRRFLAIAGLLAALALALGGFHPHPGGVPEDHCAVCASLHQGAELAAAVPTVAPPDSIACDARDAAAAPPVVSITLSPARAPPAAS